MISLYNVMGIILRWRNFNYMLEIDILGNYFLNNLGVLRGDFFFFFGGGGGGGLGVQKTLRRPAG